MAASPLFGQSVFNTKIKDRKEEDTTAKNKLAQNRFTLLQVAEKLRNLSEACRRHGVSRMGGIRFQNLGLVEPADAENHISDESNRFPPMKPYG